MYLLRLAIDSLHSDKGGIIASLIVSILAQLYCLHFLHHSRNNHFWYERHNVLNQNV